MENQVTNLDKAVEIVEKTTGSGFELLQSTQIMLLVGMSIYILGMILVGYLASGKVNGMGDFLVAGRRLPLWMATATAVWLTYVFVGAAGIELSEIGADGYLATLLQSDEFGEDLTCGAVYGFLAGLVAFCCSYFGERLVHWRFDVPEDEAVE